MNQHPIAFGIAYALIGATFLASMVALVLIVLTPVTPVAHKSDVNRAVGKSSVAYLDSQVEKELASEIQNAGLTLTSQKLVSVDDKDPNTLILKVRYVTKEQGVGYAKATFVKGIWTFKKLEPAE